MPNASARRTAPFVGIRKPFTLFTRGSTKTSSDPFMLALRSRGLGSVFTNAHLLREQEIAGILGIPTGFTQTCLVPVAYTKRSDFSRPPRRPLADVVRWNRWES